MKAVLTTHSLKLRICKIINKLQQILIHLARIRMVLPKKERNNSQYSQKLNEGSEPNNRHKPCQIYGHRRYILL